MSQIKKLDTLIHKILQEELGFLQELSPELMHRAAKKADAKTDDIPFFGMFDPENLKKVNQADRLDSHINPEVKKEIDRVKNIIGAEKLQFRPFNSHRNGILIAEFDNKKILYIRVSKNPEMATKGKNYKLVGSSNMEMEDLPKESIKELEKLIMYISSKQLAEAEEEKEFVTKDGTANSVTPQQRQAIAKAKAGAIIKYRKAGSGTTSTTQGALEENEDQMEDEIQEAPCGSCIAGQLAEIMDKLSALSEAAKDSKHKKLADKVMKQLEAAKGALEALSAHEMMLEEKEKQVDGDAATKQLKSVRKQIDKILKDKELADRVMERMPVEKMVDLKKKAKKDIDEAGLARILVKHSLREGFIQK